jgi:hypothetical protein
VQELLGHKNVKTCRFPLQPVGASKSVGGLDNLHLSPAPLA